MKKIILGIAGVLGLVAASFAFAQATGKPADYVDPGIFKNLVLGFSVALSWQNLWYCFIGCFLGTLIGVLPGIGPVATIAMLLPITFNLPPIPALIMLAGIYYGASYGGYATMMGLAQNPELFKCGINYVGVTDLPLLLNSFERLEPTIPFAPVSRIFI